jgi:hypothetical protein
MLMTQAVIRRILTTEAQLQFRASPVTFVMTQVSYSFSFFSI